jgi:hypothetical protein
MLIFCIRILIIMKMILKYNVIFDYFIIDDFQINEMGRK